MKPSLTKPLGIIWLVTFGLLISGIVYHHFRPPTTAGDLPQTIAAKSSTASPTPALPSDQLTAIHPVERAVARGQTLAEESWSPAFGLLRRERLVRTEIFSQPLIAQEDWRFEAAKTNWICLRRDLFVADQFIIRVRPEADDSVWATRLQQLGLQRREQIAPGLFTVRSRHTGLSDWRKTWADLAAQTEWVEQVEPDGVGFGSGIPSDPDFANQWGYHNTGQSAGAVDADVDGPEFWDIMENVNGVRVAVLDSGLNFTHPDLQNLTATNTAEVSGDGLDNDGNGFVDDVRGWDFTNTDNNPTDDHGHGSNVTGIIGANRNNNVGGVGLVSGVKILVCKILNASNAGLTSHLIAATTYARQIGVPIMNLSLQNYPFSTSLNTEFTACRNAGILLCICAGNQGVNNDVTFNYPSCYQQTNIIAVGNHDRTDVRWSGSLNPSNYGATNVDLYAPGRDIYSPVLGTSYAYYTGTSQATPFVTALAAALKALHPAETAPQLIRHILDSVDARAAYAGICTTGGRLNAVSALTHSLKQQPQTDFDLDGFGDFHEYLAGTRVDLSTNQPATTNWLASGALSFRTSRQARTEGNLQLEYSTNLVTWSTNGVTDFSTTNLLQGSIPVGPQPLGFLRLRVQTTP